MKPISLLREFTCQWDHTVLPATGRGDLPAMIPADAGTRFIYQLRMTGWVGLKIVGSYSHLNSAVNGCGVVATESESKKKVKYACLTSTFHFVPIAIETLGAFGQEAQAFMRELGRRITTATGERRATEFLWQRLSVDCHSARQR